MRIRSVRSFSPTERRFFESSDGEWIELRRSMHG
jgi:hypothetical protein